MQERAAGRCKPQFQQLDTAGLDYYWWPVTGSTLNLGGSLLVPPLKPWWLVTGSTLNPGGSLLVPPLKPWWLVTGSTLETATHIIPASLCTAPHLA